MTLLHLLAGDRLEPSEHLEDVGLFEHINEFPKTVMFWRVRLEYSTRHRNPLFSRALGLDPAECLVVDVLHQMYLGVMNVFCHDVLWLLIRSLHFGGVGTADEILELAVMTCRQKLLQWYKARHALYPTEQLTRVSDLTTSMLSDEDGRKVKTKAAETWGVLLFLLDELHTANLHIVPDATDLLAAGRALENTIGLWDSCEWRLTDKDIQKSYDYLTKFLQLTHRFEHMHTPKRHLCTHLLSNLAQHGNPRMYSTWMDESLNKQIKKCCRELSQTTFDIVLLASVKELFKKCDNVHKRIRLV